MFQVVWLQTALNELAGVWVQADSAQRQAITAATHAIDKRLQTDPPNQGESRSHGQRVLFQPPLGITFEVHPQRSLVGCCTFGGFGVVDRIVLLCKDRHRVLWGSTCQRSGCTRFSSHAKRLRIASAAR